MNKRELTILETAIGVVSRYGYRKTTMRDIAEQAGISRQALYGYYASKDEVLAAIIKLVAERKIHSIETEWLNATSIGDKLDIFFNHSVVSHFDMLASTPDSNDLLTAINKEAAGELEKGESIKRQMLASEFAPHEAILRSVGMSGPDLADFVQRSSASFKYSAQDRDHLMRLLGALKQSTLAILGDVAEKS